MGIIRCYQSAYMETLESEKRVQVILMGILYPVLGVHTLFGGLEYWVEAEEECEA